MLEKWANVSVKYLSVHGFRGLASRLYIYKSLESHDRLPSSHTCFYWLCFPSYPSMAMMRNHLNIITQEHVGSGFGTTWHILVLVKKGHLITHKKHSSPACTDYRIMSSVLVLYVWRCCSFQIFSTEMHCSCSFCQLFI